MELDFLSPVLLAALQAEAPHPRRLLRPRSTLGRGVEFSRFLALARGERVAIPQSRESRVRGSWLVGLRPASLGSGSVCSGSGEFT